MDSRITKKRLQVTLSYDWVKILAFVVGVAFLWALAFTVGAPRISVGQKFDLFVYRDFSCAKTPEELLNEMHKKGVFSYDILDFGYRELDSETYATIISTVVYASEGDAMIISNYADDIEKNSSKMRDFVDGYGDIIFDFEKIIESAKSYCIDKGFVYLSQGGNYVLDEAVIRVYFANRMQKDPRFRKKDSERYKQGERDEIERIKLIWNNVTILEYCLNQHPELGVSYKRNTQFNAKNPDNARPLDGITEKIWAVNLGALTGGEKKITDLYARNIQNEAGEISEITADGIVVCLFNFSAQPDHAYEGIQFINQLIREYSNFLDNEKEIANLIL